MKEALQVYAKVILTLVSPLSVKGCTRIGWATAGRVRKLQFPAACSKHVAIQGLAVPGALRHQKASNHAIDSFIGLGNNFVSKSQAYSIPHDEMNV
jgi:hypothetical protein